MKRTLQFLIAALFVFVMGNVMAYNPYAPNQFDTVEKTTWEYQSVSSLAKAGLTNGDVSKLTPSYNITRYEMAQLVQTIVDNREKATATQKEQIDKLSEAFADDLKYLKPAAPETKKDKKDTGREFTAFDWHSGTIK